MKQIVLVVWWYHFVLKFSDAFVPGIEQYECIDAAPIQENSIEVSHTVTELANGDWRLRYTITWPAQNYQTVVYLAVLEFNTEESTVEQWIFPTCNDALQAAALPEARDRISQATMLTSQAPFTHDGIFQVAYVATSDGSPIPISPATTAFIETPDCYEATNDASFCAAQSVVGCGKPTNVQLRDVEYSSNENMTMTFTWSSPIQVNGNSELQEYRLRLDSEMGDLLLTDTIQHDDNEQAYIWEATSPYITGNHSYELTITPYVLTSSLGIQPGRLFKKSFLVELVEEIPDTPTEANTTEVTTELTTSSYGPSEPSSFRHRLLVVILFLALIVTLIIVTACCCWQLKQRRRTENKDRSENLNLEEQI